MSYSEYNDLYKKAQKNKNAPYVCFSFDLAGSKKLNSEQFAFQQEAMIQTMKDMVTLIKHLEQKNNTKILLSDENVKICPEITSKNFFVFLNNPCTTSGDFHAFYVYNNSIKEKDFLKLFLHCAKANNLYYNYHFQSANFETTKIQESHSKYYIGDCIGYLNYNKNDKIISVANQNEESF